MGEWNKPSKPAVSAKPNKARERSKFWVFIGLFVLVVAGLGLWFAIGHEGQDSGRPMHKKTGPIAEVKQKPTPRVESAVATGEVCTVAAPSVEKIPEKGLYTNAEGKVYFNGAVLAPRRNRHKAKYEIFDFHSENIIAGLISVEPGTAFFGNPKYGEQFNKDFLKSCERVIKIEKGDDEYVKQLKKSMIDVKIELRNRMADGEDLGAIITETRNELQKLGMVKREMQKLLREQVKESAKSEEDVDDFISAANKMLEDKGIAPLKDNPIIRKSLVRNALRNQEQAEQQTETQEQ